MHPPICLILMVRKFGTNWVLGTNRVSQEFHAEYVFGIPTAYGPKKNFGYRWVPGTGKIFTYADPWVYVQICDKIS